MSEVNEGPRMDVFAASSDGENRDLFDPKLSAHDFNEWLTKRFTPGSDLPSQQLESALGLIGDMRQAVVLFNDAYEYEQDEDDDAELDDDK